jgi:hypothetical protein
MRQQRSEERSELTLDWISALADDIVREIAQHQSDSKWKDSARDTLKAYSTSVYSSSAYISYKELIE